MNMQSDFQLLSHLTVTVSVHMGVVGLRHAYVYFLFFWMSCVNACV